jgi:glycosyltransferase involved in cell wall biosynthesis
MTNQPKRVSVVSFHSPPGSGSAHTFVENVLSTLVDAGCEVAVIGSQPYAHTQIRVRNADVRYIAVPFVELTQRIRSLGSGSATLSSASSLASSSATAMGTSESPGWKRRVKDGLWMSIIPDRQVTWTPRAALALLQQRKQRPDHIIGVFRPSSSLLAAMIGAKLLRRPWTAVLMDPWSEMVSTFPGRPQFLRKLDAKLDQAVLKTATNVVAVTPQYQQRLQNRGLKNVLWCPTIPELSGLHSAKAIEPGDSTVINLLYAGTLYGDLRDYRTLIDGLKLAEAAGVKFHLTVAGGNTKPVHTYAEQVGIADKVTWLGQVPWEEATGRMKGSVINVILLWNGPERYMIASKVFECLVAGRPILAVGPSNDPAAGHLPAESVCAQTAQQVCDAIRSLAPSLRNPPTPHMEFIDDCHREVGLLPERLGLSS